MRAQLHKEVGDIGAVVVGGEPDGVRRFNTGDGQKLGGTDDDLVSLGPGLEDVAGATVGGRRSDAQAFALSDRVVPIALVAPQNLTVGGNDVALGSAQVGAQKALRAL